MPQIVGEICVLCRQQIMIAMDAQFCPGCGCAVHHDCVKPNSLPATSHNCANCGGDPSTRQAPDFGCGSTTWEKALVTQQTASVQRASINEGLRTMAPQGVEARETSVTSEARVESQMPPESEFCGKVTKERSDLLDVTSQLSAELRAGIERKAEELRPWYEKVKKEKEIRETIRMSGVYCDHGTVFGGKRWLHSKSLEEKKQAKIRMSWSLVSFAVCFIPFVYIYERGGEFPLLSWGCLAAFTLSFGLCLLHLEVLVEDWLVTSGLKSASPLVMLEYLRTFSFIFCAIGFLGFFKKLYGLFSGSPGE